MAKIGALFEIEREAKELGADARKALRQTRARPLLKAPHTELRDRQPELPPGSATAGAIATRLSETAKAHGHDPLAHLADVLARLPSTLNRDIDALLPMDRISERMERTERRLELS